MAAPSHPRVRLTGVSIVEIPDGLLIYDALHGHYHALNACAAAVWRACDGTRSNAEIAALLGEPVELVAIAVSDLDSCGLLAHPTHDTVDRRKILQQLAAAGVLVPLISSITVASAEAAVSCPTPCSAPSCPGYNPCVCAPTSCTCSPCNDPSCPGYCDAGCGGPCNPFCFGDPCDCSPCSSPDCPDYCESCGGARCDRNCPNWDPCATECGGRCNPDCDEWDPCAPECGGQVCGDTCCPSGQICVNDICE